MWLPATRHISSCISARRFLSEEMLLLPVKTVRDQTTGWNRKQPAPPDVFDSTWAAGDVSPPPPTRQQVKQRKHGRSGQVYSPFVKLSVWTAACCRGAPHSTDGRNAEASGEMSGFSAAGGESADTGAWSPTGLRWFWVHTLPPSCSEQHLF